MKLSSRVDYALSCILRVADAYDEDKHVSVKNIAYKERLETDYVEQLLTAMRKKRILKSIRGREGGYKLATAPENISAKEVVEAIENEVLELVCFRRKGRKKRCVHLEDCKVRSFWHGLRESMESFLKSNSLAKLLQLRRREKAWRT